LRHRSNGSTNRADSILNDTEKALKNFEDILDKTGAGAIKDNIASLREAAVSEEL
jgi:molecular chaperone DnaK